MRERSRPNGGFTFIEMIVVMAIVALLIALLLPALQNSREVARRTQCKNNLSQIALALQNYEMAFEVLPPGTVNATGPIVNRRAANSYHVSWTVRILPYLELRNVYQRFDFRAGVYDPRNRLPQRHRVMTYLCPMGGGYSSYAACHAGRETPIDTDNDGCLFLNSAVNFDDVTDGCAYTMVAGETLGAGGVWGWASGTRDTLRNTGRAPNAPSPLPPSSDMISEDFSGGVGVEEALAGEIVVGEALENEAHEPAKVAPGLLVVGGFGSAHPGGANFAFCDGAVRYVSEDVDAGAFSNFGSRNDGAMPGEW